MNALLVAMLLSAPHERVPLVPRAELRLELFERTPPQPKPLSLDEVLPRVLPRISWVSTIGGGRAELVGVSGSF